MGGGGGGLKPNSNEAILTNETLSEQQVRLLMRRINQDVHWDGGNSRLGPEGHHLVEQIYSHDNGEGYRLSAEQQEKARVWLMKHYKNEMGYREQAIMDNFGGIKLIGTAPGELNNYQYPYYKVYSKPDAEGHHDTFEYKVEGGKLHILG